MSSSQGRTRGAPGQKRWGAVGRLKASTLASGRAASLAWSAKMNIKYASQVTSWACIQKASNLTVWGGCSSGFAPGSAEPRTNSPAGTAAMVNVTVEFGLVTLYALAAPAAVLTCSSMRARMRSTAAISLGSILLWL